MFSCKPPGGVTCTERTQPTNYLTVFRAIGGEIKTWPQCHEGHYGDNSWRNRNSREGMTTLSDAAENQLSFTGVLHTFREK